MTLTVTTRRPRMRVGILLTVSVVVLASVAAAWAIGWVAWPPREEPPHQSPASQTAKSPQLTQLSSQLLFTGNVYWGRYINQRAQKSDLGVKYPFARLSEFEREKYQAWIGGLECPTVPGVNLTPAQEEATLSFNCSPDYLPEAAKWYTAFTLANNHTDNQGVEGFAATKQQLDKYGIQYFGHYDPRALDDLCEVVSLPAVATYDDGTRKDAALPIALCGYHGVFRVPTTEALTVMERYAAYMPVIALPHMGAEYKPAPDQIKTDLYRAMIDHGASMVIGDHPHWVQTTEAYKGKLIVYSMGNFMFDQQFNSEVTRSAAIQVKLTVHSDDATLGAWTNLAESCKPYHDACLATATTQNLKRLEPAYEFAAIGTSNAGYQVHRASKAEDQAILERLKWTQTMQDIVK